MIKLYEEKCKSDTAPIPMYYSTHTSSVSSYSLSIKCYISLPAINIINVSMHLRRSLSTPCHSSPSQHPNFLTLTLDVIYKS